MVEFQPRFNIEGWDDETITVSVTGTTESGTFRRARIWINKNTDVPLEPDGPSDKSAISPVKIEGKDIGGVFGVREFHYRFKKL